MGEMSKVITYWRGARSRLHKYFSAIGMDCDVRMTDSFTNLLNGMNLVAILSLQIKNFDYGIGHRHVW